MGDQAGVAMSAGGNPTAGMAGLNRSKATAVHKKKDLLLAGKGLPNGGDQARR